MMHTSTHPPLSGPSRLWPQRLRSAARLRGQEAGAGVPDGWLGLGLLGLVGGIFAIDVLLPRGIAGAVPYVIPVLLTLWMRSHRWLFPMALLCSVLTVADVALSPDGEPFAAVLANRQLALLAIWSVALLARGRRRLDEALVQSEARTRSVLAATPDALLSLDAGGCIVYANPAAERLFGTDARDVAGVPMSLLLMGTARRRFEDDPRTYLAVLATGAPHEAEGRGADGAPMPIEVVVDAHGASDDAVYTVTLRDISVRRRIERSLLQTSEEERRAIGYSLHEELGQTLTGLNLMSRHLERRLEARGAGEADEAAELTALLHDADARALGLYRSLVPVDPGEGLSEALVRIAAETQARSGVSCTVRPCEGLPELEPLKAVHLYRIVQDALAWAVETGAGAVEVGCEGAEPGLSVSLRDLSAGAVEAWPAFAQRLAYQANRIDVPIVVDGAAGCDRAVRFVL